MSTLDNTKVSMKGVGKTISSYFDSNLTWTDIDWIKSQTKLPVISKGIGCVEVRVMQMPQEDAER